MTHKLTTGMGYKHGCEGDEKPDDAEKKEDGPEVPAMQKNIKAGNNNPS